MADCPCPKHPFGCYGHPHKCGCSEKSKGDLTAKLVDLVRFTAESAYQKALDDAATLVEQRNGSIPNRQEIAAAIRSLPAPHNLEKGE